MVTTPSTMRCAQSATAGLNFLLEPVVWRCVPTKSCHAVQNKFATDHRNRNSHTARSLIRGTLQRHHFRNDSSIQISARCFSGGKGIDESFYVRSVAEYQRAKADCLSKPTELRPLSEDSRVSKQKKTKADGKKDDGQREPKQSQRKDKRLHEEFDRLFADNIQNNNVQEETPTVRPQEQTRRLARTSSSEPDKGKKLAFTAQSASNHKEKKTTVVVDEIPLVDLIEEFQLFASCLPGLEPFLHAELVGLGFVPFLPKEASVKSKDNSSSKGDSTYSSPGSTVHHGAGRGVQFRATSIKDILKCHLYLGTASKILIKCGGSFQAREMAELRRKVSQMPFWRQYLHVEGSNRARGKAAKPRLVAPQFDIQVNATKSRLYHTVGIAERIEAGILDALGFGGDRSHRNSEKKLAGNPVIDRSTNSDDKKVKIVVNLHKDEVHISIDTSHTPLHRRGYRLQTAKAPLREDLAYALLFCTGWGLKTAKSIETQQSFLLDPFCGSGTIAIEGAAMAIGLPPGRLRPSPLTGSRLFESKTWNTFVRNAIDGVAIGHRVSEKLVLGSDRNKGAIEIALANAERAGVLDWVDFEHCAISFNKWFNNPLAAPEGILVATNPPFGVRLSSSTKKTRHFATSDPLLPLYQTLGHKTQKLRGRARAALLAHDIDLARRTGLLNLSLQFASSHGGLPVVALATPK